MVGFFIPAESSITGYPWALNFDEPGSADCLADKVGLPCFEDDRLAFEVYGDLVIAYAGDGSEAFGETRVNARATRLIAERSSDSGNVIFGDAVVFGMHRDASSKAYPDSLTEADYNRFIGEWTDRRAEC